MTGSPCLDFMHSIKKLEADADLAIQVQVRLSLARDRMHQLLNIKFYLKKLNREFSLLHSK